MLFFPVQNLSHTLTLNGTRLPSLALPTVKDLPVGMPPTF